MIALGRSLLALFLLLILWADAGQRALGTPGTYFFLGLYAVAAFVHMALTWNDWWLETRLAAPAHVVDLLAFIGLNFVTQGYASPFFTFFVFLLLAASIRWGWRATALTAAAIIVLYLGEGAVAQYWSTGEFDFARFAIRSSYLVVLSSMLILWFAGNQRRPRRPLGLAEGRSSEAMQALLRETADCFATRSALVAWTEADEPWRWIVALRDGVYEETRGALGEFEPLLDKAVGPGPAIIDRARGRVLRRLGRQLVTSTLESPVHAVVAARWQVDQALAIPFRSSGLSGLLLVTDIPGLCSDDLARAAQLARDIEAALAQRELLHATEEGAAMRMRLGLARDIHDSTIQLLAGISMRLEGLRRMAERGVPVGEEVEDLQRVLGREQQELRRFIDGLRREPAGSRVDLVASLRELAFGMSSQWAIACEVDAAESRLNVPPSIARNVQQLMREAVANAVRHGDASRVRTRLRRLDRSFELEVEDDGCGFPTADVDAPEVAMPRSLRERVLDLGGTFELARSPAGARLVITLPLEPSEA